MKSQTSIEFLLILSAVALFAIFVLSQYISLQHTQKAAYDALNNQTGSGWLSTNEPQYSSNSISLVPVLANLSYVNMSNNLEIIVSYPKNYSFKEISINATPNTVVLPPLLTDLPYAKLDALSFAYVPEVQGPIKLDLVAKFATPSSNSYINETFYTYAAPKNYSKNSSTVTSFVAYINGRNESILYPINQQSNVTITNSWSHCAYHNFWGNRESEVEQCGSNTYGFVYTDNSCNPFDYYGDDRYYCFSESQTANSAGSLGSQFSYEYNAIFHLQNSTMSLASNFSSGSQNSILIGQTDKQEGKINVGGAYSGEILPPPYLSYAILNRSGLLIPVNYSIYENYSTNEAGLINVLKISNGTWIDSDTLNYIQKTTAYANTSAKALLNATAMPTGCKFYPSKNARYYSCKSVLPFSYNIAAYINGTPKLNQSVQYQGSLIEIR